MTDQSQNQPGEPSRSDQRIADMEHTLEQVLKTLKDRTERIAALEVLLEEVPHTSGCQDYPSQKQRCIRCAWQALKTQTQ